MDNLPDKTAGCHRTGFTKKCLKLLTSGVCKDRWVQIQGNNPNTGEQINRFGCVDNWTAILMIENSQMQRHTTASVDKAATAISDLHKTMAQAHSETLALAERQAKMHGAALVMMQLSAQGLPQIELAPDVKLLMDGKPPNAGN